MVSMYVHCVACYSSEPFLVSFIPLYWMTYGQIDSLLDARSQMWSLSRHTTVFHNYMKIIFLFTCACCTLQITPTTRTIKLLYVTAKRVCTMQASKNLLFEKYNAMGIHYIHCVTKFQNVTQSGDGITLVKIKCY